LTAIDEWFGPLKDIDLGSAVADALARAVPAQPLGDQLPT
jgi:hypothetical protein